MPKKPKPLLREDGVPVTYQRPVVVPPEAVEEVATSNASEGVVVIEEPEAAPQEESI